MPRPERSLDPSAGPIPAFAADLRALRKRAGNPKYLQMARSSGRSRTALAEAAGGDHLPTWETVAAYVTACGADPDPWRLRWEAVQEVTQARRPQRRPLATTSPPDPETSTAAETAEAADAEVADEPAATVEREVAPVPAQQARTTLLAGILTTLAIVSASAAAAALLAVSNDADPQAPPYREMSVVIATTDSQPLALSTRPIARCAELGCGVPDVELWPGDRWVVFCYTSGEPMRESHFDYLGPRSDEDRRNSTSNGWYGSRLPDGRIGYLPEVQLTADFRGGLGLGPCEPSPSFEPR